MAVKSSMKFGTSFAVLMTLALVSRAKPLDVSYEGLGVTVPAFELEGISFPGDKIRALPYQDQYVVLNLKTRKLHTLLRSIGDGEIVLAHVKAGSTGILSLEPVDPAIPVTAIPSSIDKIRVGEPLRIRSYGTSLVENGSSPGGWQRLAFGDPSKSSCKSLQIEDSADWTSYAVGGANARYTIALFGEPVSGHSGVAPDISDTDLAVVALLPNGGENRLALFESVIRRLRTQGIEVLLLTDNARKGQNVKDPYWGEGEFVRAMADRYGCALADTAAYMCEADLLGEDIYRDSLHQNSLGHEKWAEAIAGVLSPEVTVASCQENIPDINALPSVQPEGEIPGAVMVDFEPDTGSKLVTPMSANRIARYYGIPEGLCWDMKTGDAITLCAAQAMAVDVIFDASLDFVLSVSTEEGDLVKEVAYKAPAGSPAWAVRPQARTVLSHEDGPFSEDTLYKIQVKQGSVRLYAVSYLMPKNSKELEK